MDIIIYVISGIIITALIFSIVLLNTKSKLLQSEIDKLQDEIIEKDNSIAKLEDIEKVYKKCFNEIYYYSEDHPVFKALGDYRSILIDAYSNDFKKGTTVTLFSQIALDEYLKIVTSNIESLTEELNKLDGNRINNVKIESQWSDKESANNMLSKLMEAWEKVGISEEGVRDTYNNGRESNKSVLMELAKEEVVSE